MALTHWKKLKEEVIHANPYWKYCKALFLGPNDKEVEYFYLEHGGCVGIIGVTNEGKIPMVRQYRPLQGEESLEFPMGARSGKDPLTAAKLEFAEESKMSADNWEHVGRHFTSNGMSTETQDIFVAWEIKQIEHGQDEFEEFEQVLLTPGEIDRAIAEQAINDGMTISAWCQAKPRVLRLIDQHGGKR